jgi:nitroreductase
MTERPNNPIASSNGLSDALPSAPGAFDALIDAAVRAPSGDNTQPWRFVVDPGQGCIRLRLDASRDPSPMNAGQRMARIAAGAALENLVQTAQLHEYAVELEPPDPADLAVVRLVGGRPGAPKASEALVARVTNRRLYDGRPVPAGLVAALQEATQALEGVAAHWIVGQDRLAPLADLIGRADAVMFGESSMRRAFLAQVRFDAPPDSPVAEGLSLGSLELAAGDRLALRLMRHMSDRLLKIGGAARVFKAKARSLVASASGLCLVVAPDRAEPTDLNVGRVTERAWLALTARGMAAQPMMSLPVLDNVLEHGDPALITTLGRDRVAALQEEFRGLVRAEVGGGRPAFLMRFGFAPPPSGRTGRRPLQAVIQAATAGQADLVDDVRSR